MQEVIKYPQKTNPLLLLLSIKTVNTKNIIVITTRAKTKVQWTINHKVASRINTAMTLNKRIATRA
jgi:hypothetical protein